MFAKLRMSVEEASAEFLRIVKEVYAPAHCLPADRTQKLRGCMENLMKKKGFPIDLELQGKGPAGDCAR
jgi:hypothetical protein